MSEQQQEQAREVEATGTLKDGVVTVEARLGRAELALAWTIDETDDIDVLLNAAGTIAQTVLTKLSEEQEADDRG